jgi:ribosomal protein S18 acetylase RimI-like enzyme
MDSRAAIAYKLANDRAPFLVAEADGQIVGTAITSWDGRWAWVGRMAVHRDYRRRGIAKLLLAESERALAALGADFVSLLMNRENAAALGLYEGLGYTLWEHVGYMSKKIEPLGGSPQLSGP